MFQKMGVQVGLALVGHAALLTTVSRLGQSRGLLLMMLLLGRRHDRGGNGTRAGDDLPGRDAVEHAQMFVTGVELEETLLADAAVELVQVGDEAGARVLGFDVLVQVGALLNLFPAVGAFVFLRLEVDVLEMFPQRLIVT